MPDSTGKIRLASELCYSTTDAECAGVDLCHPRIVSQLAQFLGAKSREQRILSSHLTGIEFGQKEELVDRIRRILSGYPMNENILKEMVQNAEDAGATKIHFIIDTRSLPDDKVFDERWKPLQRPALCVYNDSPFTEADIIGIRSLGRGAKVNDDSKIGKFGVGFNCVYHLTDVPTLLCDVQDGERRLCAFDPTLRSVPNATKASPGYMFTGLDQLRNMYPDVFLGYLENVYGTMGGTVFRFSLREKTSEISDEVITVKRLRELFEVFKPELHNCLLFMKNIKEISLKEIGDTNEIREIFTAKIKLSEEASQKRKSFGEKYVRTTKNRTGVSLEELGTIRAQEVYDFTTEDNEGLCQTWRIVHSMGLEFIETQSLPNSIQKANKSGNIEFTPRGDLALRLSTNQEISMHIEEPQVDGQLFNFLPLPVSLRIPVHVNGCFALDYENRRSLFSEISGGVKSDWNFCLLRNLIAPAYCKLLLEMRPQNVHNEEMAAIEEKVRRYLKLFPNYWSQKRDGSRPTYIEQMITAVYCYIASHNLQMFPVYEKGMRSIKWIGLKDRPHFDHLAQHIVEDIVISDKSASKPRKIDTMREILVESGFQLVVSSWNLEANLRHAEVEIICTTPESVLEFFKSSELSHMTRELSETPFKTVDGLSVVLEYIKYHVEKELSLSCLVNSPFLLTDNELLQVFDINYPKFLSRYSKLLPNCSDQFINYRTAKILGLQKEWKKAPTNVKKKILDSSDQEETELRLYKRFGLTEFADMLPGLLSKTQFSEKELCSVGELSDVFRRSGAAAFWLKTKDLSEYVLKKDKEKQPASWWLMHVWEFIACETKAVVKRREKAETAKDQADANRKKEMAEPTEDVQKNALDCLKTWCLLPVISSSRNEHLLPICNARAVLVFNEIKDRIDENLITILRNIGIPQPNYPVLFGNASNTFMMDYLFQTKQDGSVAVVKALSARDYTDAISKLQDSDKERLLQFLARNGHQWTTNETIINLNCLTALQRLPIYLSFTRERRAINGSSSHIVPSVPDEGSRHWTEAHKPKLFLKTIDETTTAMLTALGCKKLTYQDVYTQFIFDNFNLLDDQQIFAHMSFVTKSVLPKIKKAHMYIFQGLKFLRKADDSGLLLPASACFDPRNPVFMVLEDSANFPPSRYRSTEWLDVLIDFFGLVNAVTMEKSLEYAKKFADGFYQGDLNKLEIFIWHIASLEDKSYSELFCHQLKCVHFMPMSEIAEPVAKLHCQKGFENGLSSNLCCFENAVLFRHRHLVWSSHAILPESVENQFHGKDGMLEKLGVNLLPSGDEVIDHLTNVSQAIIARGGISDRNEHETLKTVLKEIFHFLTGATNKQAGKHIPKELPCIPAECQESYVLIPLSQTVLQIEQEIKPYLYKLPDDFVILTGLLKLWGLAESPTLDHYARVLSAIYTNSVEGSVTSDDLESIKIAIRGFFHTLDKQDSMSHFSEVKELFLLGENGKLHNTADLIVGDNATYSDRLQCLGLNYMAEFRSLSLNMPSEKAVDLLRMLPFNMRPKFASECVTENLTDELETTVEFRNAIELQNKLRGKWFKQGIFRLVKHNTQISRDKMETDNELWNTISALDAIEIKGLKRIETSLQFNGKTVPRSERESLYFFQGSVVYVTESANDSQDELHTMLAEVINQMCKGLLTNLMHCVTLILNCDQKRIGKCLDNMNIRQCDPFQVVFIPAGGEYVPPTMHCFLRQDGWDFRVGKLVALEISDSIDSDVEIKDEADYTFVEIIERITDEETGGHSCDSVFGRYKIKLREDLEAEVSGKLLYGFCKSLPQDIVFSLLDMSAQKQKDLENLDVENIRNQIKVILDETECSACNASDRRKIIKRLYLKWHPFLNNPSFYDVFEQIRKYIQELYDADEQQSQYFQYYEDRAARYRAQATPEVQEQFGISRTPQPNLPPSEMPDCTEDHVVQSSAPISRVSYPRPEDARRFITQAKYDVDAAINDEGDDNPSYEWACYKYHQAAEKALKAVKFLSSSEQFYIHHLRDLYLAAEICPNVDTSSLVENIRELEWLLPDHAAMRYPGYNRIPHDRFTAEIASEAREQAKKIVEWAEKMIDESNNTR